MALPGDWLLLPVLAQVLLTLVVYQALSMAKSRALAAGKVDLARRALHADAWPENVQQINNNIRNQLEVPVLFYVVVLVLFAVGETGPLAQGLGWTFVLTRVVHAWVHTTSNHVPTRRTVFTVGVVVVVVMLVLAVWAVVT